MRFKLFNIKFKISFYFVLVLTLLAMIDDNQIVLMAFLLAILHESGHVFAIFLFGQKPREIAFEPFGLKLVKSYEFTDIFSQIMTYLMGPIFNLLFFVLFYRAYPIVSVVSLVLGVFNLLPVNSLDGGRVINTILVYFFSERKVKIISTIISILVIIPISIGGIYLFTKTKNVSLLITTGYLISLLFLKQL